MTVDESIRARRSVRVYESRAVAPGVVTELLDLTRHAPSSMNGQPWRFVVIRRREIKAALAAIKNAYCPPEKRDYSADFLCDAPVVIAVCVETGRSWGRAVENGVLAAAFLILAAASRGLASVYLTAYHAGAPGLAAEIHKAMGLPEHVQPISLVPLGYPAADAPPKTLRALDEMIDAGRL